MSSVSSGAVTPLASSAGTGVLARLRVTVPRTHLTSDSAGHLALYRLRVSLTAPKLSSSPSLASLGVSDPMLDIAKQLEEAALNDPYFVERKLYPNVDFYSGIIYRAMGIPTDMFTVMFALGRLPGWIAQWKEMLGNKEPIARPRQIYTGAVKRNYVNIADR